jgi:hypothetical protein
MLPFCLQLRVLDNDLSWNKNKMFSYLEHNLNDIFKFCTPYANHPSVVGIDGTFNLRACFAIILVYHNTDLIRKGTTNPPIMLEAVYSHWGRLYPTYHRFLFHLQSKLAENICVMQTMH